MKGAQPATGVAKPRRPGRPPKSEQSGAVQMISREQIIERAVQMAKVEPLAEISIVGLAREFGVTTALVHYYVGSRDELISGVINTYYQARVSQMAPTTGDWRVDIERHAKVSYATMIEYGGVLRYLVSHNRFRLFQQAGPGQTDFGLAYLNRIGEIFQSGGFTPEETAMGYHLLAQYIMTAAYAQVGHQLPADHGRFILARIQEAPADVYGGAHFMAQPFSRVDAETAFLAGLSILLDGMESWRQQAAKPEKRAARTIARVR